MHELHQCHLTSGFENIQVWKINYLSNKINGLKHILSLNSLQVLELEDGKINFSDQNVDDMPALSQLETLNLSHCEGDIDIILNLVGPKLSKVNLSSTRIENTELDILVAQAPNVTSLNLEQCTRGVNLTPDRLSNFQRGAWDVVDNI